MSFDIKDIPFFHDLSRRELEALRLCLMEKKFSKGSILHSEGGECTALFFVKSGRVKIFRSTREGKEQIFEMLGPGDTCACNPGTASWQCGSTAEAVSDSTVWFLSRGAYVQMVRENPLLMHSLNELFAKRLQCFSNLIEEVTLMDSQKRVVKYLLDMLKHKQALSPKSDVLFIESTREEIAHCLGIARETVARQISELKRKKWIEVKPYQIVILDQKGLEALL